jgi:hypothetical protein
MAKTDRAPYQPSEAEGAATDQQALKGLPHAEKLAAFAEELASNAARMDDAEEDQERRSTSSVGAPIRTGSVRQEHQEGWKTAPEVKRVSAAEATREAGKQIEALVGLKVDSVSSVARAETGWDVVVNVVELSRIPHSTDVLAAYHVNLDAEGNLQSYSRSLRYLRDETGACQ